MPFGHEPDIAKAPDGERIFRRNEAHGPRARAIEPTRQQHTKRLMRETTFEGIADEIEFIATGKGLDK